MRRTRSLLLFPELEVDIEIQQLTEIKKEKGKKLGRVEIMFLPKANVDGKRSIN